MLYYVSYFFDRNDSITAPIRTILALAVPAATQAIQLSFNAVNTVASQRTTTITAIMLKGLLVKKDGITAHVFQPVPLTELSDEQVFQSH